MLLRSSILTAAILILSSVGAHAQNLDANGALPRATPESVGVPSDALVSLIERLDREIDRVDSVMVLRDGKVIAEAWRAPHAPEKPHAMYSLSKSLCSTAIGFAIDEGKMSLDQKIVDFFPDEVPADASENLKKIDIESLLSMSCGHEKEPPRSNNVAGFYKLEGPKTGYNGENTTWSGAFMAQPVPFEPKTHFCYNTVGTYMAGAALQKAVGESLCDYLTPRLFEPLHIETPYWEKSPEGFDKGGTGLYLKTEDVAKFGQFLLQKGVWNGERLLSEEWIENATRKHISNGTAPDSDWSQGYGYQFWRCRHNAYRAAGAHGQFCVVMPDQNAVVVLTADAGSTPKELSAVWDEFLANIQDAPLPENPDAVAKLREAEKALLPKEGHSGSKIYFNTLYYPDLKEDMRFAVYVPNGYLTETDPYPVVYLLHGMNQNETSWSKKGGGEMKKICDDYFAEHPDRKRIIVMPSGRKTNYRDSYDGTDRYETFFFETFIPYVEKRYRCKPGPENRELAGLSMGGYGTLIYALRHSDMFGAAYAMSPGVSFGSQNMFPKGAELDDAQKKYASEYNLLDMADRLEGPIPTAILIDCGDDDRFLAGSYPFFRKARNKGLSIEFRVRDGDHTWQYWRDSLPLALDFFAKKQEERQNGAK